MRFIYASGATPYSDGDSINLIPRHITLQSQLNEWEQANILEAESWVFSQNNRRKILTAEFIQKVHYKMFDKTWKWAGKFRQHQTNIGCKPFEIAPKLRQLLSDINYYLVHKTYSLVEIAVRLHRGLVYIHCFPNGNGRHARIIADLFLITHHHKRLSWGKVNMNNAGELRNNYISALRLADHHDFSTLIAFAES